MHYLIGDLGHLFVILSFVTALVTVFSYFRAVQTSDLRKSEQWKVNGRTGFILHALGVLGICIALFTILAKNYFEYHYAYSHSDSKLPVYYLISTFWNGQEGSFLLWMFWNAILGIVIIFTNKFWEAPVMVFFALVQAFLTSMILGVVFPGIELKIGSSPFILLRDVMQGAPIFQTNPDFIPAEGTGLNPLLQNYWMVIHPPTLFLGFATTLVPFAYCLAGLWLKKFKEWVRPALPWALFSAAVLGLGILMGGYWAYETLNFGGYWNWDPVENAVYVPWIILVAAIHTMITYKNSETALKVSVILVSATFILILYQTFLTRSGILGDGSVHSFTDLGLNGQLLIYLFFFLIGTIALAAIRWKHIPSDEKEVSAYSREFWIFIGVTVLCFMGFHVLFPTSYPVINKIAGGLGFNLNLAVPGDQINFYSKYQLWFAVCVAILNGMGQFFWWKKMDGKEIWNQLYVPLILTALVALAIISFVKIPKIDYLFMLVTGLFTVFANGSILVSLLRKSPGLSGGSVAHIGVGLMLIGILFSAGYSKVVSFNNTGMLISRDLSDEYNREHLLLFVNETREMAGYKIEYGGIRFEPRGKSGFINPDDVYTTSDPFKVVAIRDVIYKNKKLYAAKDTITIFPENTYYEVTMTSPNGATTTLYPRIQDNPTMGTAASPDIKRELTRDIYAHVDRRSSREDIEWSKLEELRIKMNTEFFANDYVGKIVKIERINEVPGISLTSADVAIKMTVLIGGEKKEYVAEPLFIIKDKVVARPPFEIRDLGIRITLLNVHPDSGDFSLGIETRQKDWIVLRALEKPMINILWIGTMVLMLGFGIAIQRRYREFRLMKAKGEE